MNRRYLNSIANWDMWDESTLTPRQKATQTAFKEIAKEHGKFLQDDGPEGAGYVVLNLDIASDVRSCKDCVFSYGTSCQIVAGEIASTGRCNYGVFGEPNDSYLDSVDETNLRHFKDE